MIDKIEQALFETGKQKPLILNLTNFVTMDLVANCLLALGAAPIMTVCEEELEELIQLSSTVYINIGTLNIHFSLLIKKAMELAEKYNKPMILDPVGAGSTAIRLQTAQYIMRYAKIIRGNASEIIALGTGILAAKGVEPMHTTDDAQGIAKYLARENKTTVIVSGPVDFVTDSNQSVLVPFGSSLMQRVTGMGCAMTAVIAAFKASVADVFEAAVLGAHYFALCGEIASEMHAGPGSFRTAFIDQLHKPDFVRMREIYDR